MKTMETVAEIVHSCRVCGNANQDDFEKLIQGEHALSPAGKLYEEMLGLMIDFSTINYYPHYLCSSCELQMKLFRKLKAKALQTLEALNRKFAPYEEDRSEIEYASIKVESQRDNDYDYDVQYLDGSAQDARDNVTLVTSTSIEGENEYASILLNTEILLKESEVPTALLIEKAHGQHDDDLAEEPESTDNDKDHLGTDNEELASNQSHCGQADTEIVLYEECIESAMDDDLYIDVDYLDDVGGKKTSPQKRSRSNKYKCHTCHIEFTKRSDLMKHRKSTHGSKNRCSECSKTFLKVEALRVHLKQHQGLPPYQCDLCSKTFNQKVHYKYHLDRHNNVRKFKCECGKAFLSKSDLNVHKRTHNNDRRYCCDLCGKDFLIMQHLKMHRYSHFGKTIECEICKQKFTSPSTLRTHIKTIHSSEASFQCELCARKFRRKHHLLAHYKIHEHHKNLEDGFSEESQKRQTADEEDFMEMIEESEEELNDNGITLISSGIYVVDDVEDGNIVI